MAGPLDWFGLGTTDPQPGLGLLGKRMNFDPNSLLGRLATMDQPPQGQPSSAPTGLLGSSQSRAPLLGSRMSIPPGSLTDGPPPLLGGSAAAPLPAQFPPASSQSPQGGADLPSMLMPNALQPMSMPGLTAPQPMDFAPKPKGFDAFKPAAAATPSNGMPANVPYGDKPIAIPGHGMLTRAQAENVNGIDGTDYDDAAKALGIAPQLQGPPMPPANGVQSGLQLGSAMAGRLQGGSPAPNSPGVLETLSKALGSLYGAGGPGDSLINLGVGMSSGPGGMQRALQMTQQQGQAAANQALNQQQLALQAAKQGQQAQGIQQRLATLKAIFPTKSNAELQGIASSDGAYASVIASNEKTPDQVKADKAQFVTVKLPDGTEQQQWVVPGSATGTPVGAALPPKQPDAVRDIQFAQQNWQALSMPNPADPANRQFWSDFSAKRLGGGGVSVSTTLPPVEKASDQAFGKAEGDHFGSILKAGDDARQTQGQLAFMNDAFQSGGSNITTGPAAKAVLAGKQLIQGLTGIDLGGVPESEAVNKLGFGLATSLVQDISKRGGTQAEFIRGLQNVPGIFMSQPGSRVMMSVLNQQAQQKIDLGELVQDPANRKNWAATERDYFASHPLVSPFTGKPLAAGDLNALRAAAQQEGINPSTGLPLSAGGAVRPSGLGVGQRATIGNATVERLPD